MKKIKNRILSVLLFAFSILVIHDYVVLDANANFETSFGMSEKTVVDCTSKIHSQIHLTMDVPRAEVCILLPSSNNKRIFKAQKKPTSYIVPVLQRPPIA